MSRYTRHTQLKGFGPEAQAKLQQAKVLVVGAGGLGVPVLQYLNAMGVGELHVLDGDKVSLQNLHRQTIYGDADIGEWKADCAVAFLKRQNAETKPMAIREYLSKATALERIAAVDVVVDASDNFATRYLVNDACMIADKPFIYGGLHGYEGQLSVFNYQGGPSYRCLFPNEPAPDELPNCNTHGVLGVLPGIIGNLMALEAVKVLCGIGKPLSGELLLYYGLDQAMRKMRFKRNEAACAIRELKPNYEVPCELQASIDPEQLNQALADGGILVDVRSPAEYKEYHHPEALSFPLEHLATSTGNLPEGPLYLICATGVRSQQAMDYLASLSWSSPVYQVAGGMQAFKSSQDA